jgi:hypothetical protein
VLELLQRYPSPASTRPPARPDSATAWLAGEHASPRGTRSSNGSVSSLPSLRSWIPIHTPTRTAKSFKANATTKPSSPRAQTLQRSLRHARRRHARYSRLSTRCLTNNLGLTCGTGPAAPLQPAHRRGGRLSRSHLPRLTRDADTKPINAMDPRLTTCPGRRLGRILRLTRSGPGNARLRATGRLPGHRLRRAKSAACPARR